MPEATDLPSSSRALVPLIKLAADSDSAHHRPHQPHCDFFDSIDSNAAEAAAGARKAPRRSRGSHRRVSGDDRTHPAIE